MLDRIDEMVEFHLPGEEERRSMIAMYVDKYLLKPPQWAKAVVTENIGEAEIEQVVKETKGFSGRAISKLAIAWQAAAYGNDGAVLNREAFFKTVEQHKSSMSTKDVWLEEADKRAMLLAADQ